MVECQGAVIGNRTGADHAVGRSITHHERRVGSDVGDARVAVTGDDLESAASDLIEITATADGIGEQIGSGAVECQRAVVNNRTTPDGSGRSAVAHLEGAVGDRGCACIVVGSREDCGAASNEAQTAGSGDRITEQESASMVQDQETVVDKTAGTEGSVEHTVTDLENTAGDRGEAAVAVCSGEDRGTAAGEGQVTRSDDRS